MSWEEIREQEGILTESWSCEEAHATCGTTMAPRTRQIAYI